MNTTVAFCYIIPYNSLANVVRLLAKRSDAKSNVKLGRFWSRFQASYMSSHTEELRYNETVRLWMTIYIYIYITSMGHEKKKILWYLKRNLFYWKTIYIHHTWFLLLLPKNSVKEKILHQEWRFQQEFLE